MLKTLSISAVAIATALIISTPADARVRDCGCNATGHNASRGGALIDVDANVGGNRGRGGLLNVDANVLGGSNRGRGHGANNSVINVDANVLGNARGHGGLLDVDANIGGANRHGRLVDLNVNALQGGVGH